MAKKTAKKKAVKKGAAKRAARASTRGKARAAKATRAQRAAAPMPEAISVTEFRRIEVPRVRGAGTTPAATPGMVSTGVISVAAPPTRRLIALPTRGLRAQRVGLDDEAAASLFALYQQLQAGNVTLGGIGLASASVSRSVSSVPMRVVDSIAENGAKLIEVNPQEEGALRAAMPGLRFVPEVFYEPLSLRLSLESDLQPVGAGTTVTVNVRSADGGPLGRRVKVVGFTNFALRRGAETFTNASGVATLSFTVTPPMLERLYVFADADFWSGLLLNVPTGGPITVQLRRIDLAQPHALRHYFGEPALAIGTGVTVGVIDTGCGPHPDLVVAGGFNAVSGEDPAQFGDNGDLHGTHVAGIIAARGAAPSGMRGVAPGVRLFSYRVFPKGSNASNFDIAKAIDRAREDNCDLINLSLGRPAAGSAAPDEPLVRIALEDARDAGILPIAAAGNDFRKGVSFPGADDLCVAVSALGNSALLVTNSVSAAGVAPPAGTDVNEFIGDFSNVGPQVDLTGPGVGVVSTVAPNSFAVMDGTSMACPAMTGVAARLLESKPAILGMSKGPARATALANELLNSAASRGFAPLLEGRGLAL
jgi:subtilisin